MMKHCIIVKFVDTVEDKAALVNEIRAVFAAEAVPQGVEGYSFVENCVARPNRYDLMIVVHMPVEALPVWDASAIHKRWKSEFGGYVVGKAIFDCE